MDDSICDSEKGVLQVLAFEFSKRIVSTIHAFVGVIYISFALCSRMELSTLSGGPNIFPRAVTLSYLLYDMVCCFVGERVRLDNTFHHLVCIAGIMAAFYYQKLAMDTIPQCGSEMVMAVWLGEMSSPLQHLREFLKELGYRDTACNLAADISFSSTYIVARFVFGAYLAYGTLSDDNPPIIKVVSAFWLLKIVRIVKYELKERAATKYGRKALEESNGVRRLGMMV